MGRTTSLNHEPTGKWAFDEGVTEVFDDMLERSIPSYQIMRDLTHEITCRYARENTNVIDLGCSTGGAIKRAVKELPNNHFIGVEVSEPMFNKAKINFIDQNNVTILDTDLREDFP